MKLRDFFVSNSSSSSFFIKKKHLTKELVDKIKNHISICQDIKTIEIGASECNAWNISEDEFAIRGDTIVDNFDMYWFLIEFLDIPKEYIKWNI